MIRELRRRQRRLLVVLGVLIPMVFTIAIVNRKPPVTMAALPAPVIDQHATPPVEVAALPLLFTDPAVNARLLADSVPPSRISVELVPAGDPRQPDLLVYWSEESVAPGHELPPGAYLIGSMVGGNRRVLPLPQTASNGGGTLILFSLGHSRLVGVAPLPPVPAMRTP